jgi:O-antigen/teichoic acid export membrane protein
MIMAVGSVAGPALQAKGRVWLGFGQNASWGATFVILTVLTAPAWGAAGVAFSMFASYVFLAVWSFIYLRTDLPAGTLPRVILAVGFVVSIAFVAIALGPVPRALSAIPAAIITALVTIFIFVDEPVRRPVRTIVTGMMASRQRRT